MGQHGSQHQTSSHDPFQMFSHIVLVYLIRALPGWCGRVFFFSKAWSVTDKIAFEGVYKWVLFFKDWIGPYLAASNSQTMANHNYMI
jgi:hypothetical protein